MRSTKSSGLRRFFAGLIVVLAVANASGHESAFASSSGDGALGSWGGLDRSFGSDGKVLTPFPGYFHFEFGPTNLTAPWIRAANAPGGGLAVTADESVVRYLRDGSIDSRFAGDSWPSVHSVGGNPRNYTRLISAVSVDSSGRTLVAFWGFGSGFGGIALVRFTPEGDLDPTFGEGDGVVLTDFGLPPPYDHGAEPEPIVVPTAIAVDEAGRIVVGGYSTIAYAFADSFTTAFVARLNEDGSIDRSFGKEGVYVNRGTELGDGGPMTTVSDIAVDGSSYLVLGRASRVLESPYSTNETSGVILRLTEQGAPDEAFGIVGLVSGGTSEQIELDKADRIVVGTDRFIYRFLPDGSPDSSFGGDGRVKVDLPAPWSGVQSIAVAPGDRILFTGYIADPLRKSRGARKIEAYRLVLGLLNPVGRLERKFGRQGLLQIRFGRRSNTVGDQVVSAPNGKLTAIGITQTQQSRTGLGLALIRLKPGH